MLLLCPAYSAAAVRFLLDYFDCVIVLKLWYNFYSLFHSLSITLAASQRASAVFFKLFSLFAVFGATLSPFLPPCNTSIFVLAFFLSLSSLFFALVFDVSQNNFCLLLFFALDFSFLGVKRIEKASFK